MKDTIIRLKEKPEHIRRRIAVATSAGVTALVAIVWVTTMASSGAFALGSGPASGDAAKTPDSFALSGTNVQSNFSQLMGAVSAVTGATSSQPSLTIVDGGSSSSFDDATATNPSATVIPF